MSDEAETLQTLFYAKRRALYPSTVEADVFDTALRALESQNQALQERIEELDSGIRDALDVVTGWTAVESLEAVETIGRVLNQLLSPTQETDPE